MANRLPDRFGDQLKRSRIHLIVKDFIFGTEDRPSVDNKAVESFGAGMKQMLARNPQQFNLDVQMADATKLVLVWQRSGASAGYVMWIWQDRIVALSVLLSGLDDDADNATMETLK